MQSLEQTLLDAVSIDKTELSMSLAGIEELLEDEFIETTREIITTIQSVLSHLQRQTYTAFDETLEFQANKLKGVFLTLGQQSLADACDALVKANKPEEAAKRCEIIQSLDQISIELTSQIRSFRPTIA